MAVLPNSSSASQMYGYSKQSSWTSFHGRFELHAQTNHTMPHRIWDCNVFSYVMSCTCGRICNNIIISHLLSPSKLYNLCSYHGHSNWQYHRFHGTG